MRRDFYLLCFGTTLAACASQGEAEELLQSQCVQEIFPRNQVLSLGASCSNHGVSGGDCDSCAFASDCKDSICAHDTCQEKQCESDADCDVLPGGSYKCEPYSVSVAEQVCNYGYWCRPAEECEAGTFCDGVLCCSYSCVDGERQQGQCWQQ